MSMSSGTPGLWAWPLAVGQQPGGGAGAVPGQRGLTGYTVVATDGEIGKIDDASETAGSARIVVDTGPWIFGRKSVIPAAAITDVDHEEERVHVDLSKEEIKNAPEYDEEAGYEAYREQATAYYGGLGRFGGAGAP